MKPQIFLSYSRDDFELMQHVKDSLLARGLSVWTDELLVPGTPEWEYKIAEAIENSKAVIVVLTPPVKRSRWILLELTYAEKYNLPIYPLLAVGTEQSSVPIKLISHQYIDLRTEFSSGINALCEALRNHLDVKLPNEQTRDENAIQQFFANALHDLRTPIVVIKTKVFLLQEYGERLSVEKQNQYLDSISTQIEYLSNLLTDISEISRIERHLLPAADSELELNAILEKILADLLVLAQEKNISIAFTPFAKDIFILIDQVQLERVINNLVVNAVNYTPDGGKIAVSIRRDSRCAIVSIKDTGIGISDEDKPNIFKRFFRGINAQAGGTTGTGLGLAIAKEIVEFYGGDIDFESEVNKGTQFLISLPITYKSES